ncbi:MAG: hypothetical protein ACTSQ9_05545, partial [Candidatus Hodarchaeales archaeon]
MAIEILSYTGLVIFILELTVSTILLYSLASRWRKTRIPVIGILFSLYIVLIAFVGFEFFFYIINFESVVNFYLDGENIISFLLPFYGGISSGVFLLFIEFYRKDRVSPLRASIYGAFLGAFIFNMIFYLLFPEISVANGGSSIQNITNLSTLFLSFIQILFSTNFPAAYFVSYVIIDTLLSLQISKRKIHKGIEKKLILMLQFAIIFFFFFPMILVVTAEVFGNNTNSELFFFLQHLAPHISVVIGSLLIYRSYIKAPLGLLQFHRLEKLIVINKAGLLLFSYDFDRSDGAQNKKVERDVLFSGGVLAVLTIFKEMMETTDIELIKFQEEIVMLSNNDNFIIFLVADHE